MENTSNLCLTCDNETEYDQCAECYPEAHKTSCNNQLCKTPNSRIVNVTGYCDKCLFLSKNQGYFPNTIKPINSCKGCNIVVSTELCWDCQHDNEKCWCH
jgi:hypothetical protein